MKFETICYGHWLLQNVCSNTNEDAKQSLDLWQQTHIWQTLVFFLLRQTTH